MVVTWSGSTLRGSGSWWDAWVVVGCLSWVVLWMVGVCTKPLVQLGAVLWLGCRLGAPVAVLLALVGGG